jgi:uncharacterized membrane-anchored protein YhcB (DUF1043 family)
MSILYFLGGVVVGGVIMFFVFRNNKKTFAKVEDDLKKKVKELQDKLENVVK